MISTSIRILAVDGQQLLLWALERACKSRLLNIKTVTTTQMALEKLKECHFDLFLLDLSLKDPSRLKLLQAIDDCCPYVPIIIMTTSDAKSCELNDVIRTTRKHGGWHLLEKPFSLDKLIGFIEVIFHDQGNVKVCLNSLEHNYDNEKRNQFRRAHVQPVKFSFNITTNGASTQISTKGILTDISNSGSCLLAHNQLQPNQMINFEEDSFKQCGLVSWSIPIGDNSYRCGIQFC